jgi:hypothetical protein
MREEEVHEEELNNVNDRKILSEEEKGRGEYIAGELARQLDDEKNLAYYRSIASKYPEAVLFETLSIVKDVGRQGKIKKSRGALFVDLIKRKAREKGIDLGSRARNLDASSPS